MAGRLWESTTLPTPSHPALEALGLRELFSPGEIATLPGHYQQLRWQMLIKTLRILDAHALDVLDSAKQLIESCYRISPYSDEGAKAHIIGFALYPHNVSAWNEFGFKRLADYFISG